MAITDLFRRSRPRPSAPPPPATTRIEEPTPAGPTGALGAEESLDTLGALLHAIGKESFDIGEEPAGEVRKTFERLARHVLTGAPLEGDPQSEASARRDWAAVRRHVLLHRRREATYVIKAIGDLRTTVLAFITAFARAVQDDARSSASVRQQLGALSKAAQSGDTSALRREALAAVELVEASMQKRSSGFKAQLVELATHVRALSTQLEEARRQGELDALTKVANRRCFDEFVARTAEIAGVFGESVGLMIVDVDRFKAINDTRGHALGDATLTAVAGRVVRTFPRRGDLVARYGGDEFAVVLRDIKREDARMLAARLVEAVREVDADPGGKRLRVTVSVGLALWRPGDDREQWFKRADAALYRAKQGGRDRWADDAAEGERGA